MSQFTASRFLSPSLASADNESRIVKAALPLLLIFLCVAVPVRAESGVATPKPRSLGSLVFAPCSLTASGLPGAVEAQCTTLEVPEDRSQPEGRKIALALAWVPADGEAEPDPLFMIAGGPGQSAKESYPMLHAAFRDVRRSRNVLLLDARGTGGSRPLVCRNAEGEAAITDGDASDIDIDVARDFARRCAGTLGAEADLRHYATSEHVDDIEAVRSAIGADKINLIGISYGTRVAQQYAARYPAATRAVVLDSVVPNTLVLGNEHAKNLEAALAAQFARCRADAGCGEKIGDPAALLAEVRSRLEAPDLAPVRYRDSVSGEWREEKPSFGHLALLLRMYAYSPEAATLLPYPRPRGRAGSLRIDARAFDGMARNLTDQITHGMQLSVMCTEDGDELRVDEADAGSVLGTEFIDFARAQCAVWPRGTRDPAFREPLKRRPAGAAAVGRVRSGDAAALRRRGRRHTAQRPPSRAARPGPQCGRPRLHAALFAQFIETADAKALDAKCLDRMRANPPFAGPWGWEP
jgi:pimeloyl-ACP methyl ester carboxylesterase